jgi:hypothetical protein
MGNFINESQKLNENSLNFIFGFQNLLVAQFHFIHKYDIQIFRFEFGGAYFELFLTANPICENSELWDKVCSPH